MSLWQPMRAQYLDVSGGIWTNLTVLPADLQCRLGAQPRPRRLPGRAGVSLQGVRLQGDHTLQHGGRGGEHSGTVCQAEAGDTGAHTGPIKVSDDSSIMLDLEWTSVQCSRVNMLIIFCSLQDPTLLNKWPMELPSRFVNDDQLQVIPPCFGGTFFFILLHMTSYRSST